MPRPRGRRAGVVAVRSGGQRVRHARRPRGAGELRRGGAPMPRALQRRAARADRYRRGQQGQADDRVARCAGRPHRLAGRGERRALAGAARTAARLQARARDPRGGRQRIGQEGVFYAAYGERGRPSARPLRHERRAHGPGHKRRPAGGQPAQRRARALPLHVRHVLRRRVGVPRVPHAAGPQHQAGRVEPGVRRAGACHDAIAQFGRGGARLGQGQRHPAPKHA